MLPSSSFLFCTFSSRGGGGGRLFSEEGWCRLGDEIGLGVFFADGGFGGWDMMEGC